MMVPMPVHPVGLAQLAPVLVLRAGQDYEVQMESVVAIGTIGRRESSRYRVGEIPEELGAHLTGTIRNGWASDSGTLRLEFDSGYFIEAFADEDYEAWSVVGAGGSRVVCMPGGELAVWSARD